MKMALIGLSSYAFGFTGFRIQDRKKGLTILPPPTKQHKLTKQ
jgi:hypothetical protein